MTKKVIVSGKADEKIINNLKSLEFKVIKTIECKEVYDAISFHPDIAISKIDSKTFFINPKYYSYYFGKISEDYIKKYDIKILKGQDELGDVYPENIKYNLAVVGCFGIHNFDYTDKALSRYLDDNNYKKLDVKQAYTKCSTVVLGDKGLITSDKKIYEKATANGIDSLLIDHGQVALDGFDYGFIGGASGYCDDTLYLTGSLDNHSSKDKIIDFLDMKNIDLIYLSKEDIIDLGSLIFV